MSDEKPFAVVEMRDRGGGQSAAVVVAGGVVAWSDFRSMADDMALAINAAVEAREAKLRGALEVIAAFQPMRTDYPDHPAAWSVRFDCPTCGNVRAQTAEDVANAPLVRHDVDCVWAIARAALGQNTPAYAPKSQLDEANATIAKMRAAFDALNPEAYANGELIAKWLEANGMRAPLTPTALDVMRNASARPHDPARLRRLMEWWGATAIEAEQHMDGSGSRPIWALAERLADRGIYFDYGRMERDRAYYEAAQTAAFATHAMSQVPGTGWPDFSARR